MDRQAHASDEGFWQCSQCLWRNPTEVIVCTNCGLRQPVGSAVLDYLKGLERLELALTDTIEGSTLNPHQVSTLSYIAGYLNAAQQFIKQLEKPTDE